MRDVQVSPLLSGVGQKSAPGSSSSEERNGPVVHTPGKGSLLLIGNDPLLAETRAAVLESAGFRVITLTESQEISAEELPHISLVLICRTVKGSMARQIAASVRQTLPETPILRFAFWRSFSTEGDDPFADSTTSTFITPAFLLTEVNRVIAGSARH